MPFPLLFPLLFWSSAAFAGDAPPAAPAPAAASPLAAMGVDQPLADPAAIAAFVDAVHRETGAPVLIAAAGPDAEHVALKVAAAMPTGHVRVLRIGYIGDAAVEMTRALATAGMRCGVRLAATSAGTWLGARHGDCGAAAPGAVPAAPASTAPVVQPVTALNPALAAPASGSIPGLTAALPRVRVESAPAAPYLAPPPPPPDPEVLAATYKLIELRRVRNPSPRDDLPQATWAVRDGRGRTLSAIDFARRTGDLGVERRIQKEAKVARALGLGLAVGGGALALAGLGVIAARDAGEPQRADYEPNSADYSNEEYVEALAKANADFRAAEEAHAIRADDRVWIGGFLLGAGTLSAVISPFALQGANDRQALPALYWDKAGADALIAAHNATVRQRIGMPEPVVAPPVAPPPPPAVEEEDEADEPGFDADPPEDKREEDAPSDPAGAGPKIAPDGAGYLRDTPAHAPVFLLPYFGLSPTLGSASDGSPPLVGVAGLSGTF